MNYEERRYRNEQVTVVIINDKLVAEVIPVDIMNSKLNSSRSFMSSMHVNS